MAKSPAPWRGLRKEAYVAKGKHRKAMRMAQLNNPTEATKESTDTVVSEAPSGTSIKAQADAEERLAAIRAEMVQKVQEAQGDLVDHPEDIAAISSRGREYLMQRLREHAAKQEAKQEERPRPAISPAMQAKIDAEIEGGRRTQAKHQAQWDARPQRKPEVWDGKNEVVARPSNLVPDPTKTPTNTSVSGTFAAGHRPYSPNV